MAMVLKEEPAHTGVDRREIEFSLDRVAKQLQLLDEKIKNRYDHEIWKLIQLEQDRMKEAEERIERIIQYK